MAEKTEELLMSTLVRVVLGALLLAGSAGDGRAGAQETEAEPDSGSLDEFIPTEQISPGSEVSFPVDI